MENEYSIRETIVMNYGRLHGLQYELRESNDESTSNEISSKKERRTRIYQVNINRRQYEKLSGNMSGFRLFTFEQFADILRPFVMGFYIRGELENAYSLLSDGQKKIVQISRLNDFVQLINQNIDPNILTNFIEKVDANSDGKLSFSEFRTLILKGIGREIISNSA